MRVIADTNSKVTGTEWLPCVCPRRRSAWLRSAFTSLIVGFALVPAYGQSGRTATIVTDGAPVLLLPDPSRVPLTKLATGTSVRVLDAEGEWVNIEFQDARFGARVGYVLKVHLKLPESSPARDFRQPANPPAASAPRKSPGLEPSQEDRDADTSQSTRCRSINCVSPKDLMNARPPVLVNPRISETVKRGED